MDGTLIHSTLVVLCVFFTGVAVGVLIRGMTTVAQQHDIAFGEHESDAAPYPRYYE